MSQFDMEIVYIKGEDNTLVDACPKTKTVHTNLMIIWLDDP